MSFSTSAANDAFKAAFTLPSSVLLTPPVELASSKELYQTLGKFWADGHRAVQALEGEERHVPDEGSSLKEDVHGAVEATLDGLWIDKKPKLGGVGPVVQKRISGTMMKSYDESMRGAAAHLAAAADRAAAAPFSGIPPPNLSIATPPATEGGQAGLITTLMSRLEGGAGGAGGAGAGDTATAAELDLPNKEGKDGAASALRVAGVSPTLLSASSRLLTPGPPPLRVERVGASLAETVLQEEWSFTRWAEQQGMQGHALREAKTIARALELATHDFGPAYLVSRPAEVQLRRLTALALSVKAGWRVASHLEELPGDSIISALPASLVKKLYDAFSLEMKIEEAAKGKKGEKKD